MNLRRNEAKELAVDREEWLSRIARCATKARALK